jgi:hypothetical protein
MEIDSLRSGYPAPEPCSAVYCLNAQAAIGKLLSLMNTRCVDINDADRLYRNGLETIDMGGGVVRFCRPPLGKEASS